MTLKGQQQLSGLSKVKVKGYFQPEGIMKRNHPLNHIG